MYNWITCYANCTVFLRVHQEKAHRFASQRPGGRRVNRDASFTHAERWRSARTDHPWFHISSIHLFCGSLAIGNPL